MNPWLLGPLYRGWDDHEGHNTSICGWIDKVPSSEWRALNGGDIGLT